MALRRPEMALRRTEKALWSYHSISSYILVQFEFYLDFEFIKLSVLPSFRVK